MLKTNVLRAMAVLVLSIGFIAAPVSADVPPTPVLIESGSLNDAVAANAKIDASEIEMQANHGGGEAAKARVITEIEIACSDHLGALHKGNPASQPSYVNPIYSPPDAVDWRALA